MSATSPVPPGTVHRWTPVSRTASAVLGTLVLALAFAPFVFAPEVTAKLTGLFVLVIVAAMWNALSGYAGLVSVGQQGFIGLGAYGVFVLVDRGMSPFTAIVLAALLAGAVAVPTSFLAFRLTGGQFAIGMWAIAEFFRLVVVNTPSLGGGSGRSLTDLSTADPAVRQAQVYWLALALMSLLLLAVFLLLRSRTGAALEAIRDDPAGAASVGVRVTSAKRLVFVLAAVGCGAAGGLILANSLRVQPDSIFGVQWSAYMIFMVVIGGLGTFEGPIVGAIVFFLVQDWFGDNGGTWYLIGLGALAICMTLWMPQGLWGTVARRRDLELLPVGYRVRTPAVRSS
ncbi:branched-chain amino acid ABC transporter permease [Streptomyces griseiscabiei]|uniref:Branched-chain amino acid ABC transporter permease n=1 Tax=Streptomyces griseiscabiei TaxID=2993540 RepID=A0ABU4LBV7_9ACTN|nr:branched-chain amino acid ABC transporter permease [Streptomyces griseiscabiei]MBZ3900242.1 branched-chain amino acid ABC transporter permease [Streptomyces griseiscabiei]MDX2913250.1 branched-chain amino acid ABC transporter permease [Streptomyces griseiscabiei]